MRDDEPKPVDARVQDGADDAQRRVNDAGPEERGDEAGSENGLAGKHGQHGAVEQPDQQRCDSVNAKRGKQAKKMKLGQKGVALACPADESAGCQQVHGIPHAVESDEAEEGCWNNHGDAAGDAALDAGHYAEGFNRKNLPMIWFGRQLLACPALA